MKTQTVLSPMALALLTLSIASCAASTPSPQLVNARSQYQRAEATKSTQLALDSLYEAKQALDSAERAHEESPNSYEERSRAYVAARAAELAMAKGAMAHSIQVTEQSKESLVDRQQRVLQSTRKDVRETQEAVQDAKSQLASQTQQLRQTEAQLEQERQARLEAQGRADAAFESLKDVATVKSDTQTTTISLSGSVMFLTGKATLLPIAHSTLDRVAKSLADVDPQAELKLIGYTDNQGSAEMNLELSRARAQSVADYLASKGISRERLKVKGMGEQNPVAPNDSPEGRANNRRVELVISHASQPAVQAGAQPADPKLR